MLNFQFGYNLLLISGISALLALGNTLTPYSESPAIVLSVFALSLTLIGINFFSDTLWNKLFAKYLAMVCFLAGGLTVAICTIWMDLINNNLVLNWHFVLGISFVLELTLFTALCNDDRVATSEHS